MDNNFAGELRGRRFAYCAYSFFVSVFCLANFWKGGSLLKVCSSFCRFYTILQKYPMKLRETKLFYFYSMFKNDEGGGGLKVPEPSLNPPLLCLDKCLFPM